MDILKSRMWVNNSDGRCGITGELGDEKTVIFLSYAKFEGKRYVVSTGDICNIGSVAITLTTNLNFW